MGGVDDEAVFGDFQFFDGDALGVGTVEGVGDAQKGGEFLDDDSLGAAEVHVGGVGALGFGSAMVADDLADEFFVDARESEDVGVPDDVLAVFVVAGGADEAADFVEDGGGFQKEAGAAGESELGGEGVVEDEGLGADEFGVVHVASVVFGQGAGAGDDLGGEDFGAAAGGVVHEEALADARRGDEDFVGSGGFDEGVEDDQGGVEEFGFVPGEIEAGDEFFGAQGFDFGHEFPEGVPGDDGDFVGEGAAEAGGDEAGVAAYGDEFGDALEAEFMGAGFYDAIGLVAEEGADVGSGAAEAVIEFLQEAQGADGQGVGAGDFAFPEDHEVGIAGAYFDDEGVVAFEGGHGFA